MKWRKQKAFENGALFMVEEISSAPELELRSRSEQDRVKSMKNFGFHYLRSYAFGSVCLTVVFIILF